MEAECAVCAKTFVQRNSMARVCSPGCAIKSVRNKRKAEQAEYKKRKELAKPRSKWVQEAQKAFNAAIRKRDEGKGCISCGTHNGKANAGHFLSTGARPELRFDEANVHLQCERCNTYLHGNLIAYRQALIERIGLADVERLEGPCEPKKYTIDDLKDIRDIYRAKVKAYNAEHDRD